MAIIPLRVYNHEIEGMIDNGQLDEAVAHCRHILATYPKHIATYRLMGKAHLEQQRISDATDIFQRVLSSVPDDFIANVGMSIIREDENNLDAAIWHMELAYEAQPTNAAIQDELLRLYGRRDGMQPSKVRLTRGALARFYAKGGLYDQAIAELRAAISEDPNRPDLQVLLAEMYFQMNQRVEAVETCANIIKKIPFCLEANRILAVSLPDAETSEAVRNYRQNVISMDPYYAFASPDAITSDDVPENAINIERLDWKSGIQVTEAPPQPNWATSLGISMDKPIDESVPEWLKSSEAPAPIPSSEKAGSSASPFIWDTQEVQNIINDTSKPEGEIPDWMKDAGWLPSTGEAGQPPAEINTEEALEAAPVSGELEKAEIPDWLQGMAPEDILNDEKPAETPAESDLSTPWLEQHEPGPTDSIIHWLEDTNPEKPRNRPAGGEASAELSEDEVPDWLKDLEPAPPPAPSAGKSGGLPAAFTLEPTAFMEETKPVEETFLPTHLAQTESTQAPTPAAGKPAAEPVEEVPDWLKALAGEIPAEEVNAPADAFTSAEMPAVVEQPVAGETPSTEQPAEGEGITAVLPAAFIEDLPVEPIPPSTVEPTLETLPNSEESLELETTAIVEQPPVEETPFEVESPPVATELTAEEVPAETPAVEQELAPEAETQPAATEIAVEEIPAEAPVVEQEPAPEAESQPIAAEIPVEVIPAEAPVVGQEPAPEVEIPPMAAEIPAEAPVMAQELVPEVEIPPGDAEVPVAEVPVETPAIAEIPIETEIPAEAVQPSAEAPILPSEAAMPIASQGEEEEEIPDWMKELPTEPEELPVEGLAAPVEPVAAQELPPAPSAAVQPSFEEQEVATPAEAVQGEAEAIAWLEGLAAEESARKEAQPTPPEGAEILPPEWVKLDTEPPVEETIPPEAKAPEAGPVPPEEVPDWIKGLGEQPAIEPEPAEAEAAVTPMPELSPEEELPAWLRELEEIEPEKGEAVSAEAGSEWKGEEMPAWLQEMTAAEPSAEAPAAIAPAAVETPVTAEAPSPAPTEAPVEVPIAAEAAPVIEPAAEWTAETTPPAGIKIEALAEIPVEQAPTLPEITEPVQLQAETVEEAVAAAPAEEAPAPVEAPPVIPDTTLDAFQAASKTNQAALGEARNALSFGAPSKAVSLYQNLISQSYHLEDIIKDLEEGLYRYPVDVDMWVTIGDAYYRLDDLPEALNAYNKAEDLVR